MSFWINDLNFLTCTYSSIDLCAMAPAHLQHTILFPPGSFFPPPPPVQVSSTPSNPAHCGNREPSLSPYIRLHCSSLLPFRFSVSWQTSSIFFCFFFSTPPCHNPFIIHPLAPKRLQTAAQLTATYRIIKIFICFHIEAFIKICCCDRTFF